MNTPHLFQAANLKRFMNEVSQGLPDGTYCPVRPLGLYGICLRHRLRCAWLVFTGRADVVTWDEEPR